MSKIIPHISWFTSIVYVLKLGTVLVLIALVIYLLSRIKWGKLDVEHGIYCYYGRLGQGKTFALVRDILVSLNRGVVHYTNFTVRWNGYDERSNLFLVFLGSIGLKRYFKVYPASNLRQLPTDENWHREFSKITNAVVDVDEAYVLFDSYQMAKMPMSQRMAILQARKYRRSIWYTTQRPTNVHVVMRGMTNVFYRCEKWNFPFFTLFARNQYDLGAEETVDEEKKPLSRRFYMGKKSMYKAYDTYETIGITGVISGVGTGHSILKTDTKEVIYVKPKEIWAALAARVRSWVHHSRNATS